MRNCTNVPCAFGVSSSSEMMQKPAGMTTVKALLSEVCDLASPEFGPEACSAYRSSRDTKTDKSPESHQCLQSMYVVM
jgi:hypothetical protein